MKALAIAGTAAMFLVGGGILAHGIAPVHHWIEQQGEAAGTLASIGGLLHAIVPATFNLAVGVIAGAAVLAAVSLVRRVRGAR
jgi:predicted DNA repair protein MutK